MASGADDAVCRSPFAGQPVFVVLEGATLEVAKLKQGFVLLNGDDHRTFLTRSKKDPAAYRPDILHQCLLTLLDSPLNKAGLLRVYVHSSRNQLIEISAHTRIPRTYPRFAGLMVQLLHRLSIRAADGSARLMRVVPNPIDDHLPVDCLKIGCSSTAECKPIRQHLQELLPLGRPACFFIGAFAHGNLDLVSYEKAIAFSAYALSASVACGKLCSGIEDLADVV